jgi:hypothetical protein
MFGMHPEYKGEEVSRTGKKLPRKDGYNTQRTAYFDEGQQEAHLTYVDEEGRFHAADGSLLDSESTEKITTQGIGGHLYVQDEEGQGYVVDAAAEQAALNKDAGTTGVYQYVHHSSLTAGGAASGYGERYFEEGRLTDISDMSGHLHDTLNPAQAAGTMQTLLSDMQAGADLSGTRVHLVEKKLAGNQVLPATESTVDQFLEAGGDQQMLYAMQVSAQEYYDRFAAEQLAQQEYGGEFWGADVDPALLNEMQRSALEYYEQQAAASSSATTADSTTADSTVEGAQ